MATIAENLLELQQTKANIKTAIEGKGQDLTDVPFTQYANKISAIQTGGGEDRLQWICDNVKSLRYTFYYYGGETQDYEILNGLDTSKVTNMSYMFSYTSVGDLDLTILDVSSVTDFSSLFYRAAPQNLDVSNWNTSSATNMGSMFNECGRLNNLDLSSWDTSNVTSISSMFYGCRTMDTISNINLISATSLSNLFYNCVNLTNLMIYNIKKSLTIGSGTSYGTKLTLDSIIHTIKELWDLTGSTSQKLTMSTASKNLITDVYVKLVDITDDMIAQDENIIYKKPCIVCESTDEGAMTITEYVTSKNWAIA